MRSNRREADLLRAGTEPAPLSGHCVAMLCRLTIKARKRLKRDKPEALAVPDVPNHTSPINWWPLGEWSIRLSGYRWAVDQDVERSG